MSERAGCFCSALWLHSSLAVPDWIGSGTAAIATCGADKSTPRPVRGCRWCAMDWTNTAHLLQALLVAVCVLMFVLGYRAGDRL